MTDFPPLKLLVDGCPRPSDCKVCGSSTGKAYPFYQRWLIRHPATKCINPACLPNEPPLTGRFYFVLDLYF